MYKEGIPIPSTNKTLFLQLNKWLGYDKPKKDDFNADNQKIDEACRVFSQDIEQLEAAQAANASVQALNTLSSALNGHSTDKDMHVTAAEKTAWSNGAGFVTGYYTGNGATTQKITLGYQPRFGAVFPVGDGVGRVSWAAEQYQANTCFMSPHGCSLGITLNNDGFTVQHSSMGGIDGFTLKLNTLDVRYVYFLWK